MSWGSHLAEGKRNGIKASTQVGHGSRWDTDCRVVYSCWGPSTLLYGGQKLFACHISQHCRWDTQASQSKSKKKKKHVMALWVFSATWANFRRQFPSVTIGFTILLSNLSLEKCNLHILTRLMHRVRNGEQLGGNPSNTKVFDDH